MVVFLLLVLGGGGYYYFSRGKAAEPVSIPALNQPAETEVPLQEESSDSPVANPQDTEADFTKEGNLIDARGTVGSWVILY